ncbi:MAG: hypothetical protein AAFP13_04010 [Pseudomonadota bacterium]
MEILTCHTRQNSVDECLVGADFLENIGDKRVSQNQTTSIVAMLGAVGFYSLFPLFNALSVGNVSPFLYVSKACFVACLIDLSIYLIFKKRSHSIKEILSAVSLSYLAAAAFTATLSYYVLVRAFEFGSNSAVAILYELWPIIFMFALPIFFAGRFPNLSKVEIFSAIIGIVGLACILNPTLGSQSYAFEFSGEILGLVAGLLMAVAVIFKSKSFLAIEQSEQSVAAFGAVELANRAFAFLFAVCGAVAFENVSAFNIFSIDSSLGFGMIEGFGGFLFWIGVSTSRRSSTQLIVYLAPVLGFFWLYAAGLDELSWSILLGAMLIFAANVFAHFKGERNYAFFGAVASAIAFGSISFFDTSTSQELDFVFIAAPITLYAILIGFLFARISETRVRREEVMFDLARLLERAVAPEKKREALLLAWRLSSSKLTDAVLDADVAVKNLELPYSYRVPISRLIATKINPVSAGELFACVSVGLIVVYSGYAGRPPSLFGDVFAFILATVVTYQVISVIEQADVRVGDEKILGFLLADNELMHRSSFEFILAGVLLVGGIAVLVLLGLSIKYSIALPFVFSFI